VVEATRGEDLTRQILLQIILEEESGGVPMFSSELLSQLIRFYGHAMQGLMGTYLEKNIRASTTSRRPCRSSRRACTATTRAPRRSCGRSS